MKNIFIIICLTVFSIQVVANTSSSDTITTLPWAENFQSCLYESPAGWTFYNGDTPNPEVAQENSNYMLRVETEQSAPSYVITPIFAASFHLLFIQFEVKKQSSYSGNLTMGYMTNPDDTSTFVAIQTLDLTSQFDRNVLMFEDLESSVMRAIAFKHNGVGVYYLDNFLVDTVPLCTTPNMPIISEITQTSALVTWDDPNEYNYPWNLYYRQRYTPYPFTKISNVTDSVTLSNLSLVTPYEVYITAQCFPGNTESSRSPHNAFVTKYEIAAPTPMEHFDIVPPPGWRKDYSTLRETVSTYLQFNDHGTWKLEEDGCGGNIMDAHAKLNIKSSWYEERIDWLVSPSINLGQNNDIYQIEFDIQLTKCDTIEAPDTNGIDDLFAVVISTNNGVSFHINNATIWNNVEGNPLSFNGLATQQHITVPLINSAGEPYQGLIQVGLYGESTVANADNDLHIDNFQITPYIPVCDTVVNLIANCEIHNEATISWEGTADQYAIKYCQANDEVWVSDSTNLTEYTLENSTSETEYVVMVRSICASMVSEWKTITFTTPINPSGIEENRVGKMQLYPNPANDIITLVVEDIKINKIELIDLSGRVVMQPQVHQKEINIENLEVGIYFIRITTDEETATLRFVKQ